MALHGWFGSARGWGSLPDYLDGSAFTYVFPDLRGYGGRRDVTGEFTMAEAAADALALADELGWALFSGAATARENRAAIITMTTGGRLSPTFIDHVVQHSLDNSTVPAFGAYLESWAKEDFSGRVQGNPVPVKVIVGEHDPALSAQVMEQTYLTLLPNAEMEVLANAGHYPMFETPVALATAMEEFLGRE